MRRKSVNDQSIQDNVVRVVSDDDEEPVRVSSLGKNLSQANQAVRSVDGLLDQRTRYPTLRTTKVLPYKGPMVVEGLIKHYFPNIITLFRSDRGSIYGSVYFGVYWPIAFEFETVSLMVLEH